jgi:hypothetical protein
VEAAIQQAGFLKDSAYTRHVNAAPASSSSQLGTDYIDNFPYSCYIVAQVARINLCRVPRRRRTNLRAKCRCRRKSSCSRSVS